MTPVIPQQAIGGLNTRTVVFCGVFCILAWLAGCSRSLPWSFRAKLAPLANGARLDDCKPDRACSQCRYSRYAR